METGIEVTQKAAPGASATQIGVQNNNYTGLSPAEASRQMTALFLENFPKLQELAAQTARQRAVTLCAAVLRRLEEKGITDLTPFSDPDVQYAVYHAERDFARFGTETLLRTLSELVARRVACGPEFLLKVVIDRAMETAGLLTEQHLNLLSLLFMCRHVRFDEIDSLQTLKAHLQYICGQFPYEDVSAIEYLTALGCTQLNITDIPEAFSEQYSLPLEEVRAIVPEQILRLNGDYGVGYTGIMLAIVNAEQKCRYRFDPKIWITG